MKELILGDKRFLLGKKTLVMGILNITPDSFYDGGKFNSIEKAILHAKKMENDGADIIDVGGESSRPGSKGISIQDEMDRVIPVIKKLIDEISIPISIDTYKSEIAEESLRLGVGLVNDVTALRGDKDLARILAEYDVPVCLMHMKGDPKTMQKDLKYSDVVNEINDFLTDRKKYAISRGISKDKIIIDPGLGFGKRTGAGIEDNCIILKKLRKFKQIDCPLLIGASRKTFIGNICGGKDPLPPNDRLEGSLAAACIAVINGADILRVHDVKETRRCIDLIDCIVR